jgi:hypothetical protein
VTNDRIASTFERVAAPFEQQSVWTLRLATPMQPTLRVAAIGTTATFQGPGLDASQRAALVETLLADTAAAASAGARVAVWTEAAALVDPTEEAWVRANGVVDHNYYKHHSVPGEPAIAGTIR